MDDKEQVELILTQLKYRLGISSAKRDVYLTAIINGIISELKQVQGISLDLTQAHVVLFIIEYADWKYNNRGENAGMPQHIRWALNNLYLGGGTIEN